MAAGQWLCFDDNQVEPWDIANLDRDCFGGKQSDSGFGDRGGLLAQVNIPAMLTWLCFCALACTSEHTALLK